MTEKNDDTSEIAYLNLVDSRQENMKTAIQKLLSIAQSSDGNLVVIHQIREELMRLIPKLNQLERTPDFVSETSKPLPEKAYEGTDYESLMKLLEGAGIISRGVGMIWKGGGYVWLGNGMRIKEEIFGGFEKVLDKFGYQPFQIPSELPREVIDAVNAGVVDLEKGTYWLAEQRDGKLRHSGLYANSSNDAVVSYFLANEAKAGGKILPFKGYSRHQIIRSHKDSINTKPFLNSDENYECFEAYSVQENDEKCEAEFDSIINMMQSYFEKLGISFLVVDQSNWGNKPVAKKVTSLQTYASQVRGSVRLASIYMHDTTFSKLFDLSTKKDDGAKEYAHQVGYGLWEGLMVPLFDHFSDEHGLCIPPKLAAHEIVFIPRNESEERKALEIKKILQGYKIKIDTAYRKRFIKRLNKHRTEGVPLRITFSENGNDIVVSRRDTLKTHELAPSELAASLPHILESISENYVQRSRDYLQRHVATAERMDEVEGLVTGQKLVTFNHCGTEDCGKAMEKKMKGEFLGHLRGAPAEGCCIACGKESKRIGLLGRRAPTP